MALHHRLSSVPQPANPRAGRRRRLVAVLAAVAALAAIPGAAPAGAHHATDREYRTCGHLGMSCLDAPKERAGEPRGSRSCRAKDGAAARKAGRKSGRKAAKKRTARRACGSGRGTRR